MTVEFYPNLTRSIEPTLSITGLPGQASDRICIPSGSTWLSMLTLELLLGVKKGRPVVSSFDDRFAVKPIDCEVVSPVAFRVLVLQTVVPP